MDKKDIIFQIKRRRMSGLTDEQIKATLINSGLSDEEINHSIEESYNTPDLTAEEIAKSDKEQKPKKKGWWPF